MGVLRENPFQIENHVMKARNPACTTLYRNRVPTNPLSMKSVLSAFIRVPLRRNATAFVPYNQIRPCATSLPAPYANASSTRPAAIPVIDSTAIAARKSRSPSRDRTPHRWCAARRAAPPGSRRPPPAATAVRTSPSTSVISIPSAQAAWRGSPTGRPTVTTAPSTLIPRGTPAKSLLRRVRSAVRTTGSRVEISGSTACRSSSVRVAPVSG